MMNIVAPFQHPRSQVIIVGPQSLFTSGQTTQNYLPTEIYLPDCGIVHMLAIGAGGGGGSPNSSGGSGGGGGGSGGMTFITIPRLMLPSKLYCYVGSGGRVANSGNAGLTGGNTIVSTLFFTGSSNSSTSCTVLIANGGGGGSATGTGGTGGIVADASNMLIGTGFITNALAGQSGAANTASITAPTTGLLVTGGAGGGNGATTFTGGGITFINAPVPSLGSTPSATSGVSGYNIMPTFSLLTSNVTCFGILRKAEAYAFQTGLGSSAPVFFSSGGAGGGGVSSGIAGFGGNGGIGSGGGGGGCISSGTFGLGGYGGHGLLIIICQ